MTKITLYSPTGGSFEIDDTPRRRRWAEGKGYTLEKPIDAPKPAEPDETDVLDFDDDEDEEE